MDCFHNVRERRAQIEPMWEESAALCWPEYRNSFSYGHVRTPGAKYTQFQLDSAGSIGSHRFMSIANMMLTPEHMLWSRIVPGGNHAERQYMLKQRGVKQYYHDVTQTLWQQRYRPEAGFVGRNLQNMQSLGVFGNMHMLTEELDYVVHGWEPGLAYISASVGEIYMLENAQGFVDGFIRHFRWTARQACQRWPDTCPIAIKQAAERGSQDRYNFLHFVMPRTDYNSEMIFSPQGKRFESCYVAADQMSLLAEGGFRSFPLASGRYTQAPEEVEGRGPTQMVLPVLKTLNATMGMYMEAGHLASKPMWLTPEDNLLDFMPHPGAVVPGGMNADGRKLVDTVSGGQIQITEEMMQMFKRSVSDAYLESLYPMLFGDKSARERSAREVVEFASDRATFMTPLGRQNPEYVAPLVYRELDVLSWLGILPDMPPVVREAGGTFTLQCTGPLAKAMQSTSVSGFMRTLQMAADAAQKTGDPTAMFYFNLNEALPEIAEIEFTPPNWMSTPQQVQQKRAAQAKQAERERQTKEMPGRAAIMKAQAISDKAKTGGNIGGALTGTAEGGMPMMPGQMEPGGRAF